MVSDDIKPRIHFPNGIQEDRIIDMPAEIDQLKERVAFLTEDRDSCKRLYEAIAINSDRVTKDRDEWKRKFDALNRRSARHSLAKDLGQAVEADAVTMARVVAERDEWKQEAAQVEQRCIALLKRHGIDPVGLAVER